MAYEQPYHHQQPYGQHQAAAGPGNWDGNFAQPSATATYSQWGNAPQQPEAVSQWYQPPSAQAAEGIARAHNWVAQHHTGKTIISDYSTDGGKTVASFPGHSPPPVPQKPAGRICGIKKNVFFIVVAIALFVLVLGIATGVGVGLALGKKSASTAAAPAETRSVPMFRYQIQVPNARALIGPCTSFSPSSLGVTSHLN